MHTLRSNRVHDALFLIAPRLAAASTGAVLRVPAGVHAGPLLIDREVTLVGEGREFTIVEGFDGPAVQIRPGVQVTLQSIGFRGGRSARGRGGIVNVESSHLLVSGCRFEQGRAVVGGAIHVGRQGLATIEQSTIAHNHADRGGGGLAVTASGRAVLRDVDFDSNRAGDAGHHLFVMAEPGGRPEVELTRVTWTPCAGRGTGIANVRGFEGQIARFETPWPPDSLKVPQRP